MLSNPVLTKEAFSIQDLHVSVEGKEILRGVDLTVKPGEIHALMGPNGSGKSTLANTLMGHPKYQVTSGSVQFEGENLLGLTVDRRAAKGIFLAFQYPVAIPGITLGNFLRAALKAVQDGRGEKITTALEYRRLLKAKMDMLKMDPSFATRYLNEGFSGGEKKRAEVLQMAVLRPHLAILDETDSGLDIDALRTVAEGFNTIKQDNPEMSALVITHYQRLLNYIRPDVVHVIVKGRIVRTGGQELVEQLEREGYGGILRDLGEEFVEEPGEMES